MRLYAAVLAMLLALPVTAQFNESVEVRVLEIEATVVDEKGAPVDDLTRDDFTVTLDGKPAGITNFFFVRRGAIEEPRTSDTPRPDAQPPLAAVPSRVLIFIDDVHLRSTSKAHAIEGLAGYIERTMDPWTTASIVTWNGSLHSRVKWSSRKETLLNALAEIAREAPHGSAVDAERRTFVRLCEISAAACQQSVAAFAESQASDAARTIEALREVLGTLAGMEGRKVLFFVSEGIPERPGAELFARVAGKRGAVLDAMEFAKTRELKTLAKEAQNAGVIFCTIDPGTPLGVTQAMNPHDLDTFLIRETARDSGRYLAKETGGRMIADRNDLAGALASLDDQISTYYSIGVRAPAAAGQGVDVKVRVKDRPRLRVLTSTRRRIASSEEAVRSAVRSHLYLRQERNPLDVRLSVATRQADRCVATLELLVPKEHLTLTASGLTRGAIDLRFAVLDERDQESDVMTTSVQVTDRHGAVVGHAVPVRLAAGGVYVLSLAVVDRGSGATSFLQREIDCR